MIEIGAGGGSIARDRRARSAQGRTGQRRRRSRPGLLRPRRHPADRHRRRSACSATSTPTSSSAARCALDVDAARARRRRRSPSRLGLDVDEAAWGIHQVVNEQMAGAARIHAIERGKDPRDYPVFAFGGAGPVHAYRVAEILRSPELIVPLRRRRDEHHRLPGRAARLRFRPHLRRPPRRARLGGGQRPLRRDGSARAARSSAPPAPNRVEITIAAPPSCATSGRVTRSTCRSPTGRSIADSAPRSRSVRGEVSASLRADRRRQPGGGDQLARRRLRPAARPAVAPDRDAGASRRRCGQRKPARLPPGIRDRSWPRRFTTAITSTLAHILRDRRSWRSANRPRWSALVRPSRSTSCSISWCGCPVAKSGRRARANRDASDPASSCRNSASTRSIGCGKRLHRKPVANGAVRNGHGGRRPW